MMNTSLSYFSELHAQRIRSLRDVRIPLAPLTVLVGENGAGKSNIMRAIQLCSEVCHELDLSWERSGGEWKTTVLMLEIAFKREEKFATSLENDARVDVGIMMPPDGKSTISLCYDIAVPEKMRWKIISSDDVRAATFAKDARWIPVERFVWRSQDDPHELDDRLSLLESRNWAFVDPDYLCGTLCLIAKHSRATTMLVDAGRRLFGVDYARLLETAPESDGPREAFEALLATDVTIGETGVPLPLYLMSLGTRQFFPILVEAAKLIAKGDGGVLALEEPEMSLPPKAQVAVGEFLATLPREGIQVLLTTHSHYLVNGALKQVRAGRLGSEQFALIECRKTADGTEATRLNVEPSGKVAGWISSFAEVDDYLFQDWVDSLPKEEQ